MLPKKLEYRVLLFCVILFALFNYSSGILTGNDGPIDITENREYGCQWLGGSTPGLQCSCQPGAEQLYIQKNSVPAHGIEIIKINNCDNVKFGKDVVFDIRRLRNIELKNVKALYFEERSLSWDGYAQNSQYYGSWEKNTPGLKILIEDSTIKEMASHSFQGRIKEIIFKNTTVENMAPFAVSSIIQCQNIELTNSEFRNIQPQAFKKIRTDYLLIEGSTFDILPSRSFLDMEVLENFIIRHSNFNEIKSGAFLIKLPKRFDFTDCKIRVLEGDAFRITMRGSVLFQNNVINTTNDGAFKGITLNIEDAKSEQQIVLNSNTFYRLERGSLDVDTSTFNVKYDNVLLNEECDCTNLQWIFPDSTYHDCFSCMDSNNEKITVKEFRKYNCSVLESYATIIIILGVVFILVILIVTGLVVYYKRYYKGNKQKEYLTDKNGKPIGVIMPDGRTYRETELHVIVERTDLLTTDL